MNCPICKKQMEIKVNDFSNNGKIQPDFKQYKRTVYWCSEDDIWMNLEIPLDIKNRKIA